MWCMMVKIGNDSFEMKRRMKTFRKMHNISQNDEGNHLTCNRKEVGAANEEMHRYTAYINK